MSRAGLALVVAAALAFAGGAGAQGPLQIPPADKSAAGGDKPGAAPADMLAAQKATPAQKPVPPKPPNAAPKSTLQEAGAVFAGLTGWCWQAPLDQGNTDTHCFTQSFNGKLVMDMHKVRNASQVVVYEGTTLYRPDKTSRGLAYDYTNSFGDVIKGQAWREGATLDFSSQTGLTAKPETTWRLAGDSYEVAQADPKAAKLTFKKSGKAEDGL